MSSARAYLRRRRLPLLVVMVTSAALAYSLVASAAAPFPIPVPDVLVKVTTKSGTVTKTHLVPIGGAPIPIDVDGPALLGTLEPDIDVSVGLVAIDELPGKPIVPNVVVTRNALAVATSRPAPPLEFDAQIILRDLLDALRPFVTVNYGFVTPPGARMPQRISAKLVGPITSGFVDPLQAKIDTPGYSGPLELRIAAKTHDLDAKFSLDFDAMPEAIFVSEDPREDGLDVLYEHNAPVADVHLDAKASLRNRNTNELLDVGAQIERLPQRILLKNTNTADTTDISYESSSVLSNPDLTATYRDLDGDGSVVTDAKLDVAGLPPKMAGTIKTVPNDEGGSDIDSVDFHVVEGQQIDAVDFEVRNFDGPAGAVPAPVLNPEQYIAIASRFIGGETRSRAAGRLLGIRSAKFERQGDRNDIVDARTDLGDGVRPLRALIDVDDRPDPSVPDADDKRLAIDTTLSPLPEQIHAVYDPSTSATDPLRLLYESSRSMDVDADATIASGNADGCGQPDVLCAQARVDDVPTRLEALLPGVGATDFSLSHNAQALTSRPDVTATVDTTSAAGKRAWANVRIDRVPPELSGRLDQADGELRAAEFHACEWNFAADPPACTSPQEAIGRVRFTVRDQPERGTLPPRADVDGTYVSLIKRDARFEATGRVDEVRHVEFRQRDVDPSTLGALVDVGSAEPFDTVVDTIEGAKKTQARINVDALPDRFTACFRETLEEETDELPEDTLLSPCETNELEADEDEPEVTPLTAIYTASEDTNVTADVKLTKPDPDDGNRAATTKVHTAILPLPDELRADVIPPLTPDRKMRLRYKASDEIPKVNFAFESRRDSDICEDPRPGRKALCVEGNLLNLPERLDAVYNPDESEGDIDFSSTPPDGANELSLDPFVLSKVTPEADSQPLLLNARVLGITPHMTGQFIQLHTPTDPPGEKSLGKLAFNACPDPGTCDGVDEIHFTATNTLIGDPLPPAPAPDADTTQDFSFVQRGADFRAKGKITKFKEIGLSKLKTDDTPSPTTKVRAAFGDGTSSEKLRAYIDRITVTDPETNAGLEEQLAHAVISQAPKAINLCFRDKLEAPNLPEPPSSTTADFCDKAPADKLAVQTRLDESAGSAKPDIDIRRLRLAKGGGTDFLDGTVFIANLAERIDVLAGKGEGTDLVVEGHNINDAPGAPPVDVASRMRFNLRNYNGDDNGTGQFPFVSLNGTQDPESDPRITASDEFGPTRNFAKVVKDVNTLLLKGSIPNIKRIALQPGPCFPADPRTPPAADFPSADVRPDYTCVNLVAAQGSPLGLAIRTKDDKNEILSMDEGFIDSVPGGDGGIFATLGKSPDGAKLNPTCGDPGGSAAAGCKPTLLSVQALKSSGQSTNLQARLAIGDEGLVNDLKDVVPLDEYSKRLNYEATVDSYDGDGVPATVDSKGARLKLGTGETGDAVRVGFNLDLPNYLDLDQPTSYSCKRDDLDGGTLSPDSAACKQDDVKAETNHGFESKDIAIRLVGANNGHLGTDVASLGRAAVMIHSTDDGKQTILTGPTPATGAHGKVDDSPTGSPPETAPAAGAHDLGLDLPGYLDARVFIRSKYEAPGEDDVQTTYYQVDGRVNVPLSLNLRDVQSAALDGTLQTGRTRSGKDVAALQLALRNAPGLGANAPNFDKPTFRVRAEMRKKHKEPDVGPYKCEGFNPGGGRTAGFGANFCIYVPGDHIEKWLDVGLNLSPPDGVSRTVDVVMDSTDYTQIDMRGSALVDGTGGDVGKGPDGRFTPQAGLRLQPFPIGLEIGLGLGIVGGNTLLLLDGDLILKLSGGDNSRLRLSQNKGKMRLLAEDGPNPAATVKTNDRTVAVVQVRAEALFGLISENVVDVRTPPYHQPVEFKRCQFPGLGFLPSGFDFFDVSPNDSTSTAIALTPGFIPAGGEAANVLTAVSELLAPIWCLFGTEDNHLVTASHPAPAFTEPGHEINGGGEAPPVVTPPQNTTPPAPGDLTVGPGEASDPDGDITLCNSAGFKNLTVKNGGILRVGSEGQVINESVDADGPGGEPPNTVSTTCTGGLTLTADDVDVQGGGLITASANRTTAGPGAGSANGGGAGHAGSGGTGGGGGSPGGTYVGTTQDVDYGSRGGAGTGGVNGGAGGGTLRLDVTNEIDVSGAIAANGGGGGSHTADCTSSGAGGGSGGHVMLTANRVTVGGVVQARGGPGGNGGDSGGGGGGGRITVNTVDPRPASADLDVGGGAAGTKGATAACVVGATGIAGNDALGTTINHAAGVSFDTTADVPPTYVEGSVPIKIKAVRNGGGRLKVLVCRRSAPASDPDTLDSALLDPPSGSLQTVIDNSNCTTESFSDADTAGGSIYTRSVTRSVADGFHGFFAIAAVPDGANPGADCQDVGSFPFFGDGCTYQETVPGGTLIVPTAAQFKVAADDTGPTLSFSDPNGEPGCTGGRLCLNKAGTMTVVSADTVGGVGLASVLCSVNGGPFDIPCGPGDTVSVDLGTTDGIADVTIRAEDRLGNRTTIAGPRWFTDRTPGQTPTITLTQTDSTPHNGWRQSKPTITVHAEDSGAGFVGTPITFFTDTSSNSCGTISGGGTVADCSSSQTAPFVPEEGIHTFQAQSTDRLGNKSLKSDVVTMKVDKTAPTTAIFLGPKNPDGNGGWYRTKPFVAFGAVDNVGGSGVNIDHASNVSKIELNIDGDGWEEWDPDDPNLLDDGVHEVCYRATDLADNTSAEQCKANIKVDSTAPAISHSISPAAPDGSNGWYVTTPSVDGSSTDPTSGVQRVEIEVDGGDWATAAPTPIAEGTHTVRTRSFDNAGNPSEILERRVFVDRSDPSAKLVSFPPQPNGRGWFRRTLTDSIAVADGRDGSGPAAATFTVNASGPSSYLAPFAVAHGVNSVGVRAHDTAGRQGALVSQTQKVDTKAPAGAPVGSTPLLTLPALGLPRPVPLKYTATNELPGQVRVQVFVQNVLGQVVRRLDKGWVAQGAGQADWNGRNASNQGVLPGLYHYRVHVTDEAGNTVLSTESRTFIVVLGLL